MAKRIINLVHTTGEPIVEYVCESVDEIQAEDYSKWGATSTCTIMIATEENSGGGGEE